MKFTATARSLGIFSGAVTVILLVAYTVTLTVGLASLNSPDQPIGDPMFTILEVLIILMMPAMVGLMVAVHAWAPTHAKTLTLTAVVFMGLLAGVTCVVHFCVLTLSRQPEFTRQQWLSLVLSFKWPSVVYALDILAWDVFFPLSMLFAAPVFGGGRLAARIRVLMIARGSLAHRPERGRNRQHAVAKYRHRRLRGGVPLRSSAAGYLVLQNDTEGGLTRNICALRVDGVLRSSACLW
jgi:hypothetical protein